MIYVGDDWAEDHHDLLSRVACWGWGAIRTHQSLGAVAGAATLALRKKL